MSVKKQPGVYIALFALYAGIFLVGILVYKDYGVGWDEPDQVGVGALNYNYITRGDRALFIYTTQFNGPFYELILHALTAGEVDSAILYLKRHLLTFLTAFTGLLAFGGCVLYLFKKPWLAFCGVLFLYLSPRIFADSFYNSKDIPFMALFILGCLTQVWFLDSPSPCKAALHGLACAAATATRVPGLILPLLTLVFLVFTVLLDKHDQPYKVRHYLFPGGVFILACGGLTVLFYPYLWSNPLHNFIVLLNFMSHYPWEGTNFYLGQFYPAAETPWHYIPVWIAVTTPLLYLLLATIGLGAVLYHLFSKVRQIQNLAAYRRDLLILAWSIAPWLAIVVFHSVVYNGWRHLYFIYPGLLLLSLRGLDRLAGIQFLQQWVKRIALTLVIGGGLIAPLSFMVASHPYQNLYFNRLAGSSLNEVGQSFDLDYWGLSYRKGLEYILAHDSRPVIQYSAAAAPGRYNLLILPLGDRDRLRYTPDIEQADYFITNYLSHPGKYPYPDETYSLNLAGAKILSVFKLK